MWGSSQEDLATPGHVLHLFWEGQVSSCLPRQAVLETSPHHLPSRSTTCAPRRDHSMFPLAPSNTQSLCWGC